MRHIKRFSTWTDKHPIAAIVLGMFALWLFAMVCLPADPPYHPQNQNRSAT